MCNLPKWFDRLDLVAFLKKNRLICTFQYSFRGIYAAQVSNRRTSPSMEQWLVRKQNTAANFS